MRVVMFGYQTWGHRTLRALLDSEHVEVAMVVTHPRSEHAYERILADSVEDLARENGVEAVLAQRPDDALVDKLREVAPDLIVANNWRTWLPPEIYNLPTHGTLNIHDSLLPAYAGFSPIIWALINGEPEVGVTAHMMNEELDAGPIVGQKSVTVGPRDTAIDLVHATVEKIEPLVAEALEFIAGGRTDWTPQDRSKASFFHKRSLEDSRIDWTWPAADLDRLVRALADPYPNAYTYYKGERIRIIEASVSDGKYGGTPGRIFYPEGKGVAIVAGADARFGRNHGLRIERVRTEDGTEYAGTEFFTKMGGYLTSHP
ncbi:MULTISPECIES: methionyl-tRNA formyltransferase [Prauserella salsuginis group]|uniref:Methionyl-tRNA formyltransferase n=2 Tax=Prauserella salsuginis group TaxID=2893672 RepID=A0A839XLD6_9PSEU|nr:MULTISPECIES: methionyl-tRNA formyltransferase [Prauserella salsuginis group]MBB3662344.1 methionyl-tRNA formyltransferase [Prauserella sediminis]MCR3720056.1 methionyl-tRNA formyltransferase [Prauserella flava]MCR3736400.1 methionyl-tRNA formyltransferase [Prauserella salsuginis]